MYAVEMRTTRDDQESAFGTISTCIHESIVVRALQDHFNMEIPYLKSLKDKHHRVYIALSTQEIIQRIYLPYNSDSLSFL